MMHVKIESIDQKLMFDGSGDLATFLTLELPTGDRVSAQVEPDVAQALIELATNGPVEPPIEKAESAFEGLDEEPLAVPTQQFEEEVYSASDQPEEETPIAWADLPEAHLSSKMKSILSEMGIAPVMPASQLVALVDQVTEKLMEAKADRQREQQQQPEVGKVQRPGHLSVARPKTGEVATFGTDEDGIPQG
jgi:hypothetical protein